MSGETNTSRQFTGWHIATILVAFFGTVAAVNFTMASYASSTFGGVVVENSYVASQEFNRWLDAARESEALGWEADMKSLPDGRVEVILEGAPAGTSLAAVARHPLGKRSDMQLEFSRGEGRFLSDVSLPEGRWIVRLEGRAGNDIWRIEEEL